MGDLDAELFVTAMAAFGIVALALRLLQLLAPRVRGTPLWMPVLTLFLASAGLNAVVAAVALLAEAEQDALAGGLARGISVCALIGQAALVQLLLNAPKRAPGRLPGAFAVALYLIAFAFAVLAPSGIFLKGIEVAGDMPYAARTPLFLAMQGAMMVGIVAGLVWQFRVFKSSAGGQREAAKSLMIAASIPFSVYIVAAAVGLPVESSQASAVVVGIFVVGVFLALRSGHLALPIPTTLNGVLDATSNPVVLIDREGIIVLTNAAAHEGLGLPKGVVGQPFEGVFSAAFPSARALDGAAHHVGDVLLAKLPQFEGPVGELGPAATPYRMVIDPLFTDNDAQHPGAAVVQFIDETQRRDAERTAARLRDLQDLVIRVMGHDLKAPIAVMQGNLELARLDMHNMQVPDEARAGIEKRLSQASQAAAGMQVVLANARAISRLEMAPGAAPKAERLDLAKMVRESVELLRPLSEVKSQTVAVAAPGELRVPLPPGLESVVANLLSNAIKYTPARGRIDVNLARDGARVVLTVTDTGPGIAPEKRPMLFRKFERLSAEQSVGSHGLGLSIAASIVELAGGTIGAHDRPDGSPGTVFRVELPAPALPPE